MKTIGLRQEQAISLTPRPPSEEERAFVRSMAARCRLQVSKGVFRYASHEEANQDWERWMAETMAVHALELRHE